MPGKTLRWLMVVAMLVTTARVTCAETVAGLPAKPPGYVNDYAGVLSPETVQRLEDLCTEVEQKADAQIAVVTIKTLDADKSGAAPSIDQFAVDLYQKWGVGKKATDRGVMLIVAVNSHKRWIEVGYGLEGILNDAKVGDIGRDMQPILHNGDFNQGISLGVRELAQDIAADKGVSLGVGGTGQDGSGAPPVPYSYGSSPPQAQASLLPVLLFGGIALVVIAVLIRTGHIGMLFFILFNLLGGGRGGGGGFGGGGEGGGGGGFGGFGGGSTGGGGAGGDF